jgi:acetoacetyl-CoA synthetase
MGNLRHGAAMQNIAQGSLLWAPPADARARTEIGHFMDDLERVEGRRFPDYASLWRFSVDEPERFWQHFVRYFKVLFHTPPHSVLGARSMPFSQFFPGATLNYAEHALRRTGPSPAVLYRLEDAPVQTLSWDGLRDAVARARAGMVRLGVKKGDRVAAFLPNCPEALIGFLAAASLGATWSSCSPEFGVESVVDRFGQIAPKVLLAVDGYRYAGRVFDRRDALEKVRSALPSVTATVVLPRLGAPLPEGSISFEQLCEEPAALAFEPCDFEHPLWILYSSGTTGLPKGIVHGHGGILLEHLKALALHSDLGPDSRFFWYTTTGWMMWNYLISGLVVGATISLYEGHPNFPDAMALFRHVAEDRITFFGTSAPYLVACEKQGLSPKDTLDFSALCAIGSTGAPLPVAGFRWVYEHVKADLLLGSMSGGTDVCTAFVLSCPLLPVHAGEIQCAGLGVHALAYDPDGKPCVGDVGELVIVAPMPSMPVGFVNDPSGDRLRASYFAEYPGVWRHGDFVSFTERGSAVIFGRSDATLNRGGVRMGTAELYRVVEALPEVADSLVVDTGALEREDVMWLFVVLRSGHRLTPELEAQIRDGVRRGLSPRHVPDRIVQVEDLPRTINGKKLEVPVKRLLMGVARERAVQPGTLANPEALDSLLARVSA